MQGEELPHSFSERATTGRRADVNPLAAGVLRRNSIKSWTKPAPSLYPHQWSWDSAFIALGLAHVDNHRATSELETLFARDRKSTRLNSSHANISYAVFCLKK